MTFVFSLRRAALILLPLIVASAQAEEGRERLDAYLDGFRTVKAGFEQIRYDETGSPQEIATGTMWLSRPGKFRWDYVTPYEQTIVADGERVWIYDKDLEQITVKNLTGAIGSTPSLLLGGDVDLDAEFVVEDLGEANDMIWVALSPLDEDNEYATIRLAFDDAGLRVMELADGFGQTTRIRFADEERNPALDPNLFDFVPPEGVDVIEAAIPEPARPAP